MIPEKIYIDNNLLIRWFVHKFNRKKYRSMPEIIKFFNEHPEISKYASILSVAELVHTLKYGKDFQRFRLNLKHIEELLSELQNTINLDIILKEKRDGVEIDGVIITRDLIKMIDRHHHLIDCMHLDIAKSHDLFFVTHEAKMGELKPLYENIMTDEKLMK